MYHRIPIANGYIQSLCLPVNLFFPLLLNLHAISKAATMTDPTTRTITTATTAPMTVPGPFPEATSPSFAGGSWDDVAVRLWMDDISATGSWLEEDARRDDAALLGETLVATVIGIAAKEVIGEGGATNVIDRMELLMTSGTVYGGYRSNKNKNEECSGHANSLSIMSYYFWQIHHRLDMYIH